jgi:large subunit ribosomal protein L29
MKRTDYRRALAAKSADELAAEIEALAREHFGLRMQKATQQLANTAKLREVRRNIARARTLQNRKAPNA